MPIPEVREVSLEKGVAGDVADVRTDVGAIELVVSHRMGAEKIAAYGASLSWWAELDAGAALEDPSRWEVLALGGAIEGRDWQCAACAKGRMRQLAEMEKGVAEAALTLQERTKAADEAGLAVRRQAVQVERLRKALEEDERRLVARSTEMGPHIERMQAEILRLRGEMEALRKEKLETLSQTEKIGFDFAEEYGRLEDRLGEVLTRLAREEETEKALKLMEIRGLEETYAKIFEATESTRLRGLRLARLVAKQEERLALRAPDSSAREPEGSA